MEPCPAVGGCRACMYGRPPLDLKPPSVRESRQYLDAAIGIKQGLSLARQLPLNSKRARLPVDSCPVAPRRTGSVPWAPIPQQLPYLAQQGHDMLPQTRGNATPWRSSPMQPRSPRSRHKSPPLARRRLPGHIGFVLKNSGDGGCNAISDRAAAANAAMPPAWPVA